MMTKAAKARWERERYKRNPQARANKLAQVARYREKRQADPHWRRLTVVRAKMSKLRAQLANHEERVAQLVASRKARMAAIARELVVFGREQVALERKCRTERVIS